MCVLSEAQKKTETRARTKFEEIMAQSVLKLIKDTNPQTQETLQNPNRMKTHRKSHPSIS